MAVLADPGLPPGRSSSDGIAEQAGRERSRPSGQIDIDSTIGSQHSGTHFQRSLIGGQLRSQLPGPHRTGTPHSMRSATAPQVALKGKRPRAHQSRAAGKRTKPKVVTNIRETNRSTDKPSSNCRSQLPAPHPKGHRLLQRERASPKAQRLFPCCQRSAGLAEVSPAFGPAAPSRSLSASHARHSYALALGTAGLTDFSARNSRAFRQ